MRAHVDASVSRIVLDSGGLSALSGAALADREWIDLLRRFTGRIEIPAVTLAESTTGDGGRDARLNRVISLLGDLGRVFVTCDEPLARRAGKLRHAARSDDGIDAIVAAVAVGDGSRAVLLTSDPHDLGRLLARCRHVEVVRV